MKNEGKDHEKHNEILEIHSRSKLMEIGPSENGSKYFSADPSLHLSALCFLDHLIPSFLIMKVGKTVQVGLEYLSRIMLWKVPPCLTPTLFPY